MCNLKRFAVDNSFSLVLNETRSDLINKTGCTTHKHIPILKCTQSDSYQHNESLTTKNHVKN